MDAKFEFRSQLLDFTPHDTIEVIIPDDFQLIGLANGDGTPIAVWVRMTPALDTQLEFDLNGVVGDANDYPE